MRPPTTFGDGHEVGLEGAHVALGEEAESLDITLWWRAHEPLAAGYTVFVHLLDGEGALIASGDDLPGGGAMPTDRWKRGDLVVDLHRITLPAELPVGVYRLNVGLYSDAGRLPAWDGQGVRIPSDSAHVDDWKNGGI